MPAAVPARPLALADRLADIFVNTSLPPVMAFCAQIMVPLLGPRHSHTGSVTVAVDLLYPIFRQASPNGKMGNISSPIFSFPSSSLGATDFVTFGKDLERPAIALTPT